MIPQAIELAGERKTLAVPANKATGGKLLQYGEVIL
jgi:hypothetical protein